MAATSSPQGTPDEVMPSAESITGAISDRACARSRCRKARRTARHGQSATRRRRARQQPEERHRRRSRSAPSPASPACPAAASRRCSIETLYKALARRLNGAREHPGEHDRIEGLEHLDKVIDIDQSPIGRTPRSNPATYTGAFTPIRDWFAGLPEAKARGYEPGRFSFNVKGGRCEACQGDGVIKIEMHFLPDVYVTCDVCKGKRYNRETLEVTFKDKSIADVLDMTVEEGAEFFKAVPSIRDKLADAGAGRARLHPYRPAGDHAVGRRGAAHQARQGAVAPRHRPHPLHPGRADDRPAFRRCAQAARGAARAGRAGQHRGGDRAQSRGHQDRRLDHRPGPRGRRQGRPHRRQGTPEGSSRWRRAIPANISRPISASARRRPK